MSTKEILDRFNVEDFPQDIDYLPFSRAIWPWIDAARRALQTSKFLHLLDQNVEYLLEKELLKRWCHYCAPSMNLEMHIEKIAGTLKGPTAAERYEDFVARRFLTKEALLEFFQEYPLLEKTVSTLLNFWVEQTHLFLERLHQANFSFGKVTAIDCSASDPHNGGASVFLLNFESGKKLIYKPKKLALTCAFHRLIDELNAFGLEPKLENYLVIDCGTWGWEEHVEHKECQNEKEVHSYYERAGMLLCLLYLLDGTDMHFENIIASGAHPILIDIETLFQAKMPTTYFTNAVMRENYVLKTGLLPFFIFGKNNQGIDVSGLSGGSASGSLAWENVNTDEMQLAETTFTATNGKNWCKLHQKICPAQNYVEDIVQGFKKMYTIFEKRRKDLLKAGSALEKCAKNPSRFIARPTRFYDYLLQRLKEPQLILHAEERGKEFSLLSSYLTDEGKKHLQAMIEAEKYALLERDIPLFLTLPTSCHLYLEEKIVIENVLIQSPFAIVRERIENMGAHDLEMQELFIRQSFLIKSTPVHPKEAPHCPPKILPPPLSETAILKEAERIAEELKKRSITFVKGTIGWIDLEPDLAAEHYLLQPISDNLYGGKVGIALFFAALFSKTGDQKWHHFSLGCLKDLKRTLDERLYHELIVQMGIGGLSGIGGVCYGLCHIGRLLKEPLLGLQAQELLLSMKRAHLAEDRHFDVIGGCAGLLLAALSVHHHSPNEHLLILAEHAAEHLINNAQTMKSGLGWAQNGSPPLAGFSHGASGIAYALFKLAKKTGNHTYAKTAQLALKYERSLYNAEKKNWPRLPEPATYPVRWCHGATGIGLSRLATTHLYNDPLLENEISLALATTLDQLYEGAFPTLCCSTLGRIEFLLEAAHVQGKKELATIAQRALAHSIAHLSSSQELYRPGLMQGAAGIGYTLLRSLDTSRDLPQILLLEP